MFKKSSYILAAFLAAIVLACGGGGGGGATNTHPAPVITTQPTNLSLTTGAYAVFTVAATGDGPLSYQWQKNGNNISGAASSTYTTPAITAADNGSTFRVLISSSFGTQTTSATATLTVITGIFTSVGDLNVGRLQHTATLLGNGKVLVVGGLDGNTGNSLSSAEIYDPATGSFTLTGSLNLARDSHTATLLPNGKVLIAGGWSSGGVSHFLQSAELFDPTTGTFSLTGNLVAGRAFHTATLLPNGKVLVVAGGVSSAELFDSTLGTFTTTGSFSGLLDRHAATLLQSGTVLITGGEGASGYLRSNYVYTPGTGAIFGPSADLISTRANHTATILSSGAVLIAGGAVPGSLLSAELFTPGATGGYGTFLATGNMNSRRAYHTATSLLNGKVLVVGGFNSANAVASAEYFDLTTQSFTLTPGSMNTARDNHTATLLANGMVLVIGGRDANLLALKSVELFHPPD